MLKKKGAIEMENTTEQKYHRAKQWEIAFFSLNNSATNIYLLSFGFLTYYATGLAGLATLTATNLMGVARLFDGLIDPTIGVMIDRTNTKIGKYRPYMIVGNVMLILSFLILFNTHYLTGSLKIFVYIFALIFHKIGYSLQQTVTKAAQPSLTNDPKQRPMFSVYDTVFSSIATMTLGQYVISNILVPRNGEFNLTFFRELIFLTMGISVIYTIFAFIGISRKDKPEFWGLGEATVETKSLKDYISVVQGNRPLQLLAVAGGIMKFVGQLIGDAIVIVMLFAITLGNYGLNGHVSLLQVIPNLIIVTILTRIASKKDLKTAYMVSIIVAIFALLSTAGILLFTNHNGTLGNMGATSLGLFIASFIVMKVTMSYPSSIILIMSADITDYETARSGRFVSGLIGTVFSLVDSLSSSMVPVITGWVVAGLGYTQTLPAVGDKLTPELFNGTLLLLMGIPLILMLITLVLIHKYPLTAKAMKEIQTTIKRKKEQGIQGTQCVEFDPVLQEMPLEMRD